MKVAKEKQMQKDIDDAFNMINQLENEESDDLAFDSDDEKKEELHDKRNIRKGSGNDNHDNLVTRKTYGDKNIEHSKLT
jgi:hypothetical protein